jgi:CubicO group peptidase (beta-lactamase class C family)
MKTVLKIAVPLMLLWSASGACVTPPVEVDQPALDALVVEAKKANSTSLVIMHRGKVIHESYKSGRSARVEAMSVTKSVVSLAIGRLLTTGKIKSIDDKAHTFYPEWNQGRKAQITIRHLLNHTSGLQSEANTQEIYRSPNFVQLALAAELTSAPGAVFNYNNKAMSILAGIVQIASGQRLDQYVQTELFQPLGISDTTWLLDKAGNPHAMAGLQIHARDLAKLGQLMLQEGTWDGKQLISREWVKESTSAGSAVFAGCGLLWWLEGERDDYVVEPGMVDRLRERKADEELIAQVEKLVGRYESGQKWIDARARVVADVPTMRKKLKDAGVDLLAKPDSGRVIGFRADGWRGQYVYVFPQSGIVAVRMIESTDAFDEKTDWFRDFGAMVRRLIKT